MTRDCDNAELPTEKRPCWQCGEPGHTSAMCKKGGGGSNTNAVLESVTPGPSPGTRKSAFFGMIDHDGFKKAKNSVKGVRPMPQEVTVQDFITRNPFEALQGQGGRKREAKRKAVASNSIDGSFNAGRMCNSHTFGRYAACTCNNSECR